MNNSTLSDSVEAAGTTVSEAVLNAVILYGVSGIPIAIVVLIVIIIIRSSKKESVHSSANEDAGGFIHVEIQLDRIDHAVFSNFPIYTYAQLKGNPSAAASDCAICLGHYKEGQVARLLPPCGHVFHRSCIDPWLMIHSTCPICRRKPTLALAQPAPIANL